MEDCQSSMDYYGFKTKLPGLCEPGPIRTAVDEFDRDTLHPKGNAHARGKRRRGEVIKSRHPPILTRRPTGSNTN